MNCTLGVIKPDAVRRGLVGQILFEICARGFTIKNMEQRHMSLHEAQQLYAEHEEKPFYGNLIDTMTNGDCIMMVVSEGADCFPVHEGFRELAMELREKYKYPTENKAENVIHSTSEDGEPIREIDIFFPSAWVA